MRVWCFIVAGDILIGEKKKAEHGVSVSGNDTWTKHSEGNSDPTVFVNVLRLLLTLSLTRII